MLEYILLHKLELTQLLLAILGAFSIIAKLTPTESDNKLLDKLLAIIHRLGLTK